jgi:hypothetical protein
MLRKRRRVRARVPAKVGTTSQPRRAVSAPSAKRLAETPPPAMRASAPPSLVLRLLVMLGALALTSCPHQVVVKHKRSTSSFAKNPDLRASWKDSFVAARRAARPAGEDPSYLDQPQIPAPRYHGSSASDEQDRDPRPSPAPAAESPPDRVANPPNVAINAPVDSASTAAQSASEPAVAADSQQQTADGLTHLPVGDREESADPLIYSIGRETWVFAEPRFDARRLGYLRFGSEVRRTSAAESSRGCSGGWYGVQPSGYVCVNGRTATADPNHPLVQARIERPDRMRALPYAYTVARRGVPRFYAYAPSVEERPKSFSKRLLSELDSLPRSNVPAWLRSSRQVFGYKRPKDVASLGDGLVGGGVALLGFYTDAGTLYGITPDLELVTTDALEAVKPSVFAGKALGDDESLPVAFVMGGDAWLQTGDPRAGSLRPLRRLARREALTLVGERVTSHGEEWLRTKDGGWLRNTGLRVVPARTEMPDWATAGQAWVDVSINQQTLVAYEGTRVAYVTLVSTGVDGLLDPATTKSTKTGIFHVVSKHLTATMNGDEPDNAYEMREVPWVQYFSEGYALHGAYWHDAFGQPRSHGCINLSPIDARWLFHFTNPGLPRNWHGAIPSERSATVYVHP